MRKLVRSWHRMQRQRSIELARAPFSVEATAAAQGRPERVAKRRVADQRPSLGDAVRSVPGGTCICEAFSFSVAWSCSSCLNSARSVCEFISKSNYRREGSTPGTLDSESSACSARAATCIERGSITAAISGHYSAAFIII